MKKYPFGIKFHSVFVIALGIKFRKVYIFFLFYFQNFGGSLPASSSASARCTDIKKGTHPLLFFLPAMLNIIRKTINKEVEFNSTPKGIRMAKRKRPDKYITTKVNDRRWCVPVSVRFARHPTRSLLFWRCFTFVCRSAYVKAGNFRLRPGALSLLNKDRSCPGILLYFFYTISCSGRLFHSSSSHS